MNGRGDMVNCERLNGMGVEIGGMKRGDWVNGIGNKVNRSGNRVNGRGNRGMGE